MKRSYESKQLPSPKKRNTEKYGYDTEEARVKSLSSMERVQEFEDAYWKVRNCSFDVLFSIALSMK